MRRIVPAALLALGIALTLGLAACGGDDDDTSVSSPGVDETSSSSVETVTETGSTSTEAAPNGSSGELTSNGVGEVVRGTGSAEVEQLLGAPDVQRTGPGCELAPDSPDVLTYIYELEPGQLILSFEAASGELSSYRSTSPALETTLGDSVGDEFATLRQNFGSSLEPLDLGVPATPRAGIWIVTDGPEEELWFDVRGGVIRSISGGDVQICE